jgi:hypothetical protein
MPCKALLEKPEWVVANSKSMKDYADWLIQWCDEFNKWNMILGPLHRKTLLGLWEDRFPSEAQLLAAASVMLDYEHLIEYYM